MAAQTQNREAVADQPGIYLTALQAQARAPKSDRKFSEHGHNNQVYSRAPFDTRLSEDQPLAQPVQLFLLVAAILHLLLRRGAMVANVMFDYIYPPVIPHLLEVMLKLAGSLELKVLQSFGFVKERCVVSLVPLCWSAHC